MASLDQLDPLAEFAYTMGAIHAALTNLTVSVRAAAPIATPEWRKERSEYVAAQVDRLGILAGQGIDEQIRDALETRPKAWTVQALLHAKSAQRFAWMIADQAWDENSTADEYDQIAGSLHALHVKFMEVRAIQKVTPTPQEPDNQGSANHRPQGSAAQNRPDQSVGESLLQKLAIVIGDDNAAQLVHIHQRTDLTPEEKMNQMLIIDRRLAGKKSPDWAVLLSVSEGRVRQLETWKRLQARATS